MSEEIFEVVGAIAAAFVGTIVLDMWLGGGLLAGLSPTNFPGFGGAASTAVPSSQQPASVQQSSGGSGATTGGIMSANI